MLHGLWSPGSGLVLWRDEDGSDEVTGPLAAVVERPFRHTVRIARGPGEPTEAVTAMAIAPADAAQVLLSMPRRPSGVSGDLRYLAHVARGIERWAQAGRVAPELARAEGQWWTRWRLLGGEKVRAWSAALLAAMPPVQRERGRPVEVLDDMTRELTDPVVRTMLGPGTSLHPVIASLMSGDACPTGSARIAEALDDWRGTLAGGEPDLVLRLVEPDDDDPDSIGVDALWRLEVCLRENDGPPTRLEVGRTDPYLLEVGLRKLGAVLEKYPRLQDVPRDPRSLDLLVPTAVVADLVEHGAAAIQSTGAVVMLPRSFATAEPSLRLHVDAPAAPVAAEESRVGMDAIVGYRWELSVGDVVVTPEEMERLVESGEDLVRLRGSWVRADPAALARAAAYVGRSEPEQTTLAGVLGRLVGDAPPPVPVADVTASGWVAALLDGTAHAEPVPPPAGLVAQLRPYQRRGLDWLAFMDGLSLGAVLADDMGLGKTVQVLALLAHERERERADARPPGPTLLVSPMSVVGNWQREAARFTPGLRVHVHHGPSRAKGEALAAIAASHDLVVTTYALAARDLEQLRGIAWERVVLDEAQHVKNAATAQSRAVRAMPARHRVALTGTPVENRLEELRSILDFVNPGLVGTAHSFRARFAVPIERDHDRAAASRLRSVTAPFVLRRVKSDPEVIADLPDKVEFTVRANLTAEQAGLYRAVVDDMMRKIQDTDGMARKGAVLSALTRLKQVCNHPAHFLGDGSPVVRRGRHRSGKLALVEDIVESILGDGEKALLFTQFREFGELVGPYLAERFGVPVPFLHGGVSKTGRDRMVAEFQGPDGPPLMLLSLKAGGTGLNLTAANHVVHLDRWWNPAVEDQATDRVFRIGQRRDVEVRKLVCVGTVEERIDEMITGKKELADLAVGTGENWITELSTDELHDMLALGDDAVGE